MHHISRAKSSHFTNWTLHFTHFTLHSSLLTSCVLLAFASRLFTEALCFRPTEQRHKDCAREVFKHHSFYRQGETPGIPQRVVRVSNRPDARRLKQGNLTLLVAVTRCIPHWSQASQKVDHPPERLLGNLANHMTSCWRGNSCACDTLAHCSRGHV